MSYFVTLLAWVQESALELEQGFEVKVLLGPASHAKRAMNLTVESDNLAAELLVWDSGEVDFNTRVGDGSPVMRHIEIAAPDDLIPVLDALSKFLRLAQ